MCSRPSSSASSSPSGSSGAGQPAARNSPSAASSASRSAAATIWCTREGESLTAAASARMDTPSARADASAQLRSRSACSRRHLAVRSAIFTHTACPACTVQQSGHAGGSDDTVLTGTPYYRRSGYSVTCYRRSGISDQNFPRTTGTPNGHMSRSPPGGVRADRDLAYDRQLTRIGAERFADQVVDHVWAVVLGRVDVIDSGCDRCLEHADGRCPVSRRIEGPWTGQLHRAVPGPSDLPLA